MDERRPQIELRGVRVHNLQDLNVDLPIGKWIGICGVSGSGKTSLALDTLYAEGQRRYIESFSAYTRQFLDRLEKPAADRIDGLPPAIAMGVTSAGNRRSTIATMTEVSDYLRLLLARVGQIECPDCKLRIVRDSPESVAQRANELVAANDRWMIAFSPEISLAENRGENSDASEIESVDRQQLLAEWSEKGFLRGLLGGKIVRLVDLTEQDLQQELPLVIVDRLQGAPDPQRARDSLEIAFDASGHGCVLLVPMNTDSTVSPSTATSVQIDGVPWQRHDFSADLRCPGCSREFLDPTPQLFSFNHSLGACPTCEGFGDILEVDMGLVVPDPTKSIRERAIAPWTTPAYEHEWQELMTLSDAEGIDVDLPFGELSAASRRKIEIGVPRHNFGGLRGFFDWLEQRRYKTPQRVFLGRWKSERRCPGCHGKRLRPEALAVRVGGLNYGDWCQLRVREAAQQFSELVLDSEQTAIARVMLDQLQSRLGYLEEIGLGYLTLERAVRSLSGGEAQRVALTKALGSSLVNLLYVLDEPSAGLHPHDVQRLTRTLSGIRDRGNTVIMVEHEETLLRAADHLVEIGPRAGSEGGKLVFSGTCEEMLASSTSITGQYLSGRLLGGMLSQRRPSRGRIGLSGASGNNLKVAHADFPLGVLCVVTGVSGSGKTSLVQRTLYGALCKRLGKECPAPLPYSDVFGDGQIDDVIMVDQSPIGKSPRSNPVTYVKAFDSIRQLFASTVDARTRNFGVGHFSFNAEGGRCDECQGDGSQEIDMQFLANMRVPCPRCQGSRYRKEVLEVRYRSLHIAEVLKLTVREAISFFRGEKKIQSKLQALMDVGLGYLSLGQPATTLSRGEAQRLKLSTFLGKTAHHRTLFLLDEPTAGLHFSDIVKLLDCFNALISVGHSLIIVEHNRQLMLAADYIVDLGPGPGDEGGQIVFSGTPEEVAACGESRTGTYLKEKFDAVTG
jgi:excinuclease ABC subunit A